MTKEVRDVLLLPGNNNGISVHLLNPKYWISLANMNLNIARIEKMRRDNELFAMKISKAVNM
ncbi:hypothetical protein, partial [Pseudomonas aeruginosa]|uniref:hypothetical protein n=1 Tax=Pseudomonas aeruginosa TaxID=287 RepID=UPI001C8ACB80